MARHKIDWEKMEKDWRAGIKTVTELAREYGVSHVAIIKHWRKAGVERDLSARIRDKTKSLVARMAAASTVGNQAAEEEIINLNAAMQRDIILEHRTQIKRCRKLCMSLIDELEQASQRAKLRPAEAAAAADGDDDAEPKKRGRGARGDGLDMPSRVDSMRKLADTLKTLIALEREAFGIDDRRESDGNGGNSNNLDFIKALQEANARVAPPVAVHRVA
jgi:transposase-like protein